MLHEFLTSNREEIIARTQVTVASRSMLRAAEAQLTHGVPLFFEQVIEALKYSARAIDAIRTSDAMKASATNHGNEMLRMGFTVAQLVHDYGNVCRAVTELALEMDVAITADESHTLTRCLDDAIAEAVTEYERLRERSVSEQWVERAGAFAHEMRNRLTTAFLSFEKLKGGDVSVGGSTSARLDRSLKSLSDLIDRSYAEVCLKAAMQKRETIEVAEFVEEMEVAAVIEAKTRGVQLTVEPIEFGIVIDADRHLLATAVANLLQNAFRFTRERGSVRLRPHATADRVLIDIEDECGGRPFKQRSIDGTGLAISRRGVQLNGGEIRVRDVPGTGCIFTVDLPRVPSARISR
jgi:signal transduction histidine kinase